MHKYSNVKIVIVFVTNPLKVTFAERVINFMRDIGRPRVSLNIVVHIDMDKIICHALFFTIAAYLIRKSTRHHREITYQAPQYTVDCQTGQQYCNEIYTCSKCRERFALFVCELDKQYASWQKL